MKLTEAQKKQLITIGLTVLVIVIVEVAAAFGITVALPAATPVP